MKTLGEIVDLVRSGGHPKYEDLKYAVCALDTLLALDRMAFLKLAEAEENNNITKPLLIYCASWHCDENFSRIRRAYAKNPRDYIGWAHDPKNPDAIKKYKASMEILLCGRTKK